jgi:preprotein translocase subunit SecE
MANVKNGSTLWAELLSFQSYKRNQGRLVRQLTTSVICLVALLGAMSLNEGLLASYGKGMRLGVPSLLFVVGVWLSFRVVNYSVFADFLISVQGELGKVSWPDKQELYRSTIVVVVTMFALGGLLLSFDLGWSFFMELIGILKTH